MGAVSLLLAVVPPFRDLISLIIRLGPEEHVFYVDAWSIVTTMQNTVAMRYRAPLLLPHGPMNQLAAWQETISMRSDTAVPLDTLLSTHHDPDFD